MRTLKATVFALIACALVFCFSHAYAQEKPNVVLIFLDNFGWGEPGFNGGGIIRGAETPRMDRLADEGLRLTNFNVESQCTPSRAAIMSGRYAIRSGCSTAPQGGGVYGLFPQIYLTGWWKCIHRQQDFGSASVGMGDGFFQLGNGEV